MAIKVALSGFLALLVAMGSGRFAFMPHVPLMITDGQLTLTCAALVPAFNYLGYLLRALIRCTPGAVWKNGCGSGSGGR